MNRDEARSIYKEIKALYPMFNNTNSKEVAILWLDRLELGDYERTKKKLLEYSLQSKYPPTLADVIETEYVHKDDHMAQKIKEAEQRVQAEKNNPQIQARRQQKLEAMKARLNGYYD